MININIIHHNKEIVELWVTGHAEYKKKGEDIVCAAVSAVVQTAIEGLKKYLPVGTVMVKKNMGLYMLNWIKKK